MPALCAPTASARRSGGLDVSLASELPPASPLRSRDADRVVSKSDTKDASRSSCLQQNPGIMRFHFARFSPAKPFVSNLDIGSAVGAVSATARRCFPMHNPAPTGPRHLTSLSWVAGPPAGPVLRCTVGDIPRGWVRSAPGGGIRCRRGQESGPRTREMPPVGRKSHRPRRMSPSAAGPGRHAHVGRPARQLGPARKGRHRARLRG